MKAFKVFDTSVEKINTSIILKIIKILEIIVLKLKLLSQVECKIMLHKIIHS